MDKYWDLLITGSSSIINADLSDTPIDASWKQRTGEFKKSLSGITEDEEALAQQMQEMADADADADDCDGLTIHISKHATPGVLCFLSTYRCRCPLLHLSTYYLPSTLYLRLPAINYLCII